MAIGGGLSFLRNKVEDTNELEILKAKYRKPENPTARAVAQYDVDGNFIRLWPSAGQLSRRNEKYNKASIDKMLRRELKRVYGYIFVHADTLPYPIPNKIRPPQRLNWTNDELVIKPEEQ